MSGHRSGSDRRSRSRERYADQDSNSNNSSGIINIITSKKQGINTFANDGSFMELFKRKMEEEAKGETSGTSDGEGSKSADEKVKKAESSVKRRRNKVLKTGMVKKKKVEDSGEEPPPTSDAWTRYMAEVKKYRQQACDEDGKTRPLVK
ncbi:telomerase RNA component interacting RNase-like [Uloborus diversus]|uniref:telomerase RNA component interacting RNase-like n=1 Tax=Uloborus diversus TaxID=327109 RepID=UPI00240A3FF2|nr:telomerase RNA component interacting RNase-like [Uloborus diversus]